MSLGIIALLCLCGALTSLLSALFELGGGIVLVPVLHVLFPACEVQLLAATSLSVVMLTALINVLAFWRQQLRPDPRLLIGWALAVSAGMQLGVHISFLLPGRAILLIFAAILLLMAWRNLRCAASSTTTVMSPPRTRNYGIGLCLAGGTVAGITGLGGGSVLAPLLALLPSIPRQRIALYCNWLLLLGSAVTVTSYLLRTPPLGAVLPGAWQFGYVNLSVVLPVFACALLTQPLAMQLRRRVSDSHQRQAFSGVLAGMALFIVLTL